MKNVFYFILKANSILKISKLCHYFFDDIRKGFDKKAKNNFKTGKEMITIHILPNISRSKFR